MILEQSSAEVSDHVVVVVDHYAEGLTDNETRPDDDVAPPGTEVTLDHFADHR